MNATDPTAALVGSLISLLLSAAVYVWIALALSAVFRKSGVESWKAWVPILNSVVLLQLAGLSGWWLLVAFVPVLGAIVLVVVFVFVVYRLSVAFGFGVGMTVLGVLVFPVWASVIGWGSARWVGREVDAASRRAAEAAAGLPPLPAFPTPASRAGATAAVPAPAADPAVSGFAPPPAYTPPAPAAPAPAAAAPAPASAAPAAPETMPAPVVPAPAAPAPAAPATAASPAPAVSAAPVVVPPPGGWTPPPLPGRPVSAAAAEAALDGAPVPEASPASSGDTDAWQGFGLDTTDHSAEVTGAFPGAPAPISAVPSSGPEAIPAVPAAYEVPEAPERYAPKPSAPATPGEGIMRPPVTDVPLPAITGEDREPWAPAHSPMPEADAFPEASGPVSAVTGAAGAGIPFAARSSVSAQHTRPEVPDDDEQDVFDETVIARRKRTEWTLLPPTGDPVALTSDVVILGRRPSADAAFPTAQLVPIQDGTVSKTHARLQLRDDRWYVVDLDSTNGVLFATVMGTEVEATPGVEVEAGDRFLLGDAEVRLQRSDG